METKVAKQDETWERIPGEWSKEYFISPNGIVRYLFASRQKSKYTRREDKFKYLTSRPLPVGYGNGYLVVGLRKDGVEKTCYIHRLLALVFIPNPENKSQVNHKDGNSLNNDLSNLEWVTPKENINHAWETGLCKKGKRISKCEIEVAVGLKKAGLSHRAIAETIGCSHTKVSNIINNKSYQNEQA